VLVWFESYRSCMKDILPNLEHFVEAEAVRFGEVPECTDER